MDSGTRAGLVVSRKVRDQGRAPELFTRHKLDLAAARQALAAQPGQVGTRIYMRWVGLELLAGPGLFGRAWPRLCAGYVADAIGQEPKAWHRLVAGVVLSALTKDQTEPVPAVGLGEEYRLSTPGLAGAALVAQERMAHFMAFLSSGINKGAPSRTEKNCARARMGMHVAREPARLAMAASPTHRALGGHRRR